MFGLTVGASAAVSALARDSYAEFAPFQPDIPGRWLEKRYTDERSSFVEVGGARLHYRDDEATGGPTVLALHGVYSSLHTWEAWREELGEEVRVITLDLPGFGLTGPNEQREYTLSYYVDVVASFCDELGLGPVAVAGNSLGGAIAWRFAATYPGRADGLILLDAGRQNLVPESARLLSVPGFDVAPRYLTPRSFIRTILHDAYGDPSRLPPSTVRRYHDLLCRTGNRRAVLQLAKAASPAPMEPGAVECPTLVQWGEEDDWLPPTLGERFVREIPDAALRTYPGVGHIPMEEAPAETAADATAFLAGE